MEDALISPAGFMILSGAGLIEASETETIKVHTTEQTDRVVITGEGDTKTVKIYVSEKPYVNTLLDEDFIYVMRMENGEVVSEPYIPDHNTINGVKYEIGEDGNPAYTVTTEETEIEFYELSLFSAASTEAQKPERKKADDIGIFKAGDIVLVDYYVEKKSGAQQIEITADRFGGNYYVEASTLFRDTNGVDMPAEFIIPNCKIQSNFTFSMASSGKRVA